MKALRRLLALAASLSVTVSVGAVLVGAVAQPSSARTVDVLCHQRTPIPARAVRDGSLARLGCSLAGRTVYVGRVAVVIPPAGMSVAGDGYGVHGDRIGLRATNTGSGVRVWTGPRSAAAGRTGRPIAARASADACKDRTFHLEHHHWVSPYRYRIKVASVPKRLHRAKVVKQIKAANANMRLGRNTCGKAKLRTPAAHYLGHTTVRPDIKPGSSRITCGDYDTRNVIGFGRLPGGLLGWTCYWWLNDGNMGAADIMLDNGDRLSTNLPKHCTNTFDFEGLVTHEFGHAYGMAHTGSGHANLTMQHEAKPCSTYARTLGLGDWLGMRKMYGKR